MSIRTHYTEVLMREAVFTHLAVMTLFRVMFDTLNIY